jgi:glycosyltransferase involved in cell wall biosynthesis
VIRPRVSVGLPVYNGQVYLAETISSILSQDFEDFELIIADNCSTDNTIDLVRSFAANDDRVRLLRSDKNVGAARNYNRLVHVARGELFKWAGYDDLLSSSYLTECVGALDARPEAVLAFPSTVIIDGDGARVRDYEDRLELLDRRPWRRVADYAHRVNLCNACFGVMRREVMLTTGLIRPYVSSDIAFLAEMAARGTFVQVRQRLFYRRVHTGSSRQGTTTLAEVAHWFDTSATRAPMAPRARLFVGTVAALASSPVSTMERARIVAAYSAVYGLRRGRIRAGRVRAVLTRRPIGRPELIFEVKGGGS